MMKRRTWFGIVLAAVLALSVLLTGCGGDEEEKKALKFKTEMPEVIDFNVAFDVEEYLEYDANESVEMEASYTENGTTKTYLAAGLLFTPTTLNDVTVKVWYEGDEAGAISKTLKIRIPAPSMASVPELEIAQGEKLVFAELLDKEKYPNFNYTSLTEVTIEITKVILPNGTEETIAAGTKEYTFEDGGQYTLYFELSNEGGSYTGMANVKVPVVLSPNEENDLTNSEDGTGPVVGEGIGTLVKVEESRENSDWYYSYTAKSDTDFNNNDIYRWGNRFEIWFKEPVDLTENAIQYETQTVGNSFLGYFVMAIDEAGLQVAEGVLSTTSREWQTVTITSSTFNLSKYQGSMENVKRIRFGIVPADELREGWEDPDTHSNPGKFPATIENVTANFDNMTIVSTQIPPEEQYEQADISNNYTIDSQSTATVEPVDKTEGDGAWYQKITAKADSDFNNSSVYRWGNSIDIEFPEAIDLNVAELQFRTMASQNAFPGYFVIFFDDTKTEIGEFTLQLGENGVWKQVRAGGSSITQSYSGDKTKAKFVRFGVVPNDSFRDGDGQFPASIADVYICIDDMKTVVVKDAGDISDIAQIGDLGTGIVHEYVLKQEGGAYLRVDANPDTDYNDAGQYWANMFDIYFPEPVDLTGKEISFDIYLGKNTHTDYQVMLIEDTILAQKTLQAESNEEWITVTIGEDTLPLTEPDNVLTGIKRIRIVFGAGENAKIDGTFPAEVSDVWIGIDHLTVTEVGA